MTVGLLVGVIVFAFTNPTGNPTTGGGALSYSNGNVGIGTTDPGAPLEIEKALASALLILEKPDSSGGDWMTIQRSGTKIYNFGYPGTSQPNTGIFEIYDAGTKKIQLYAGGDSYFNAGNVGIGTTSPGTNRLEVVGGPIKATGGLIIETRTSDPASPVSGQIWLRTDL